MGMDECMHAYTMIHLAQYGKIILRIVGNLSWLYLLYSHLILLLYTMITSMNAKYFELKFGGVCQSCG